MRDGHILAQATHCAHLVAVNGMNDTAGTEEEASLEHGVGEEMEHGGHVAQRTMCVNHSLVARHANAEGHHHEGYLRNCGEGEHALDVALRTSHSRSIERGERTDPNDNAQALGRILNPEREEAGNLIDTSHNHRGSVNQGTDRRRTFHGIGQPNVQGEHGTLTSTTDKHQHQRGGKHETALGKACCIKIEAETLAVVAVNEDAHQEEHIGKAGDDERLLGSRNGSRRGEVETDEEVGRHADKLPEKIHLEDVGGDNQSQHRHGEEAQEGIVALETALAVHIAEGVDVDHQRYGADDDEHHHRDGVEHDSHIKVKRAHGQPLEIVGNQRLVDSSHAVGSEVGPCSHVGHYCHCGQAQRTDEAGHLVA